jgi:hypothetical protein
MNKRRAAPWITARAAADAVLHTTTKEETRDRAEAIE